MQRLRNNSKRPMQFLRLRRVQGPLTLAAWVALLGIALNAAAQEPHLIDTATVTESGPVAPEPQTPEAPSAVPGSSVTGKIPGLSVAVTSTYAYRDWMPRIAGPRGEDGGSPLHVSVGLRLLNGGSTSLVLRRKGRLGRPGEAMQSVELEDLAGATPWPLTLAPGEQRSLQLGIRGGQYFPLGEALDTVHPLAEAVDFEIDLSDQRDEVVAVRIDHLAVGRTE
ncbi:MAG: hypothetical protein P8M78_14545 [Myxococcota bacterium]|nr:hypothetical protein [Myxococcota bacterium]